MKDDSVTKGKKPTNDSAASKHNERNERLSTVDDPQQGIKGINPLWPLYEEQLRKQEGTSR